MTSTSAAPKPGDIQKSIAAGNFVEALQSIDRLLAIDPNHAEGLYMAAVCYRYTKQYAEAQTCLDSLKSTSHDRGRVYQEQGHLHLAKGNPQQALAAFANACQLNPVLLASWRSQHQILQAMNRPQDAQQAQAQVKRLQALPKALVAVSDLMSQGKLFKAETLCRKFLQANPAHVEAMRLLAQLAVQFGVLEDAEYLLESAAEFEPENIQVKIDFVNVLRKRQKFAQALSAAESLHQHQPGNPQLKSLYAIEKMQMGDFDGALALFAEVLKVLPGDAITLTSRGHALKTRGDQQEAIASYQAAISSNPWHGEAYYALSNLKTYRFSQAELDEMLALEQREELGPASKFHLAFALGKAFEDAKDYTRSFEYYTQGNQLKRQQSNYDADTISEDLKQQRSYFTREILESRANAGHPAPDPIFIVGLPRAGSTLLEQILSSHSQVDGTLELPNILSTAQKLRRQGRDDDGKAYPELLQDFSDEQLQALGQQYIEDTRIHRQGADFFIDKMPNNFRHIGLIKLILPNAKIIDARRHPMACCFSGFKQLFAEGQEFTYDLIDIGRYYNDYVELMAHWDAVTPNSVLRVQYENVVADLETQVTRLLDYCGLPFESACMDFHNTERAVRTASSEQVRQPIYKEGVEQWTHFQPFLGPLETTLKPSLDQYRLASAKP
ncbi:tetratricopeptide repeat protein [Halieaceae bacterium IMCC14734]|uniref:Tetratricopeptide repeat protein n=1 Tax=Candidatus Litorirhabdus singularis TaxID=2518993 RepID=A0ABT3TE61_9GAMM|nr:sulfotransferase [Candidatus Litorirhabdus singularis]MCX2980603.1 tetratricopeptide repeat protein [Candidatus Litorirhabdus singularis]